MSSSRFRFRKVVALATSAVMLPALAGCGYKPVYGTQSGGGGEQSVNAEMATVQVARISDRTGQRLRNYLVGRMNPQGVAANPKYLLDVGLSEVRQELGIRRDDTSTRANLLLNASYTLRQNDNNRIVFRSSTQRVASFNISTDNFSTISAEAAARRRLVVAVGDEILLRLGLYLNRQKKSKP